MVKSIGANICLPCHAVMQHQKLVMITDHKKGAENA
jgi:hypothetical protein